MWGKDRKRAEWHQKLAASGFRTQTTPNALVRKIDEIGDWVEDIKSIPGNIVASIGEAIIPPMQISEPELNQGGNVVIRIKAKGRFGKETIVIMDSSTPQGRKDIQTIKMTGKVPEHNIYD